MYTDTFSCLYEELRKKGEIKVNGVKVDKSQDEYLKLIKHEMDSEHYIAFNDAGVKRAKDKIRRMTSKGKIYEYDTVIFLAHGVLVNQTAPYYRRFGDDRADSELFTSDISAFSENIGIDVGTGVCFSNPKSKTDYAQVRYTWNKSDASKAYNDGVTILMTDPGPLGKLKTINLNTMKAEMKYVKNIFTQDDN